MAARSVLRSFSFVLLFCTSIANDFIAAPGTAADSGTEFQRVSAAITSSVRLAWRLTENYPQMLMSDFFSSPSIISRDEFNRFTIGNVYWNSLKTIFQIQWVPCVTNVNRSAFEDSVRRELPWFKIFRFNSSGQAVEEPRDSFPAYGPITYCAPLADYIVGLDLYNDPIEGPIIRRAQATGNVLAADPFLLRGLAETFRLGMTIYMPLYRTNGSFSVSKSSDYVGCICSVFLFHPLMSNVLADLNLRHTDVFLFDVSHGSDPNASTYLAHYESQPASTMPNLLPPAVYNLRPADVTGDFVTTFTPEYDLKVVDRTFRVLVRARAGSYPRDPLVYSIRCPLHLPPANRPLPLPFISLSLSGPPVDISACSRPGPSTRAAAWPPSPHLITLLTCRRAAAASTQPRHRDGPALL
jgi:CHASE1-domain containing sensor protein